MPSARGRLAVLCGLTAVVALATLSPEARQARPASERPPALLVDFIVVQEDGTPVGRLDLSEVEVRIDGRVRTIRRIRRVATAPLPAVATAAPPVPPPFGTEQDVSAGRSFVILVDEESLTAGREQQIRGAVDGLLETLTPADRTMVVALPFGGVKVPFTSDLARIRLAVASLAGQGSQVESGSDMACRTRRFLETLDGFLSGHAGRSTPLTVVLFTAGLAAPRRDAPMALPPGMCELLVNHFQRITVTASAARANFYVLQPADIGFSAGGWRESIAGTSFLGSDNPLEGIEHLAGSTGAARLALDAIGTASLLRVARESAAYFVAEIEPEAREIVGRSRPLAVRVNRPGSLVRARPEMTFTEPSRPAPTTRLVVGEILTSPAAATGLTLRVAGFTVREAGGQLRVGVVIEPGQPDVSLTSAGAILLDRGEVVATWFAPDAAARPLLGAMAAAPGRYRLRVAAIDNAGRSGVAEEAVDARLSSVGPLTLGSLMLGVSRPEGMAPRLEFGAEPIAIASFDIYGGTAGMGLSAMLEVGRALDGPPLATVPLALARADDSRVVATGSVPIGALPPGDYVVRGVIILEDGTTGRVVRTLRKIAQ